MKKCAKPSCPRGLQVGGYCKLHYRLAMANQPTGLVDSGPVRAHIAALTSLGVGTRKIAELAGMKQQSVSRRLHSAGPVNSRTAAKILAIPIPDVAHELANDGAAVSVIGTRRRLQALQAIGYSFEALVERVGAHGGVHRRTLQGVCGGGQPYVTARVARSVAAMFSELQLAQGDSAITRCRSLSKGWHPPLAWNEDEIDNPLAVPQTPTRSKQSEWSETYNELRGMGLVEERIAERMGLSRASLMQHLRRLEAA